VWQGGAAGEPELLASCYRKSVALAIAKNLTSLAFPSISTGIFGYPIELAAATAVRTVRDSLREETRLDEVIFCCFSPVDLAVYESVLMA
jgi:O-acetyl-ADP-ribose deacetylase (regulator of RNase III)